MSKVLVVNYGKCVGCHTCEEACSVKQMGVVNPLLSRIQIVKRGMGIENVPLACAQCESAPCETICPVKAISRDESLGRVLVDYDVCIGCRMCVAVCPFGAMSFDTIDKKVFKCDLCGGDPVCVKFCQYDALQYVEASEQGAIKRTAVAKKLSEMMRRIISAVPESSTTSTE